MIMLVDDLKLAPWYRFTVVGKQGLMSTDACTMPTADRPMRVAELDALFVTAVRRVERHGRGDADASQRPRGPARAGPRPDRARDVVLLVLHLRTEIADQLVISVKTVERHRANVLTKLGLRDRLQLTRYAIRIGLVEP